MADEVVSKNSGGRRIGVIDIDTQSIHYPQDFLKATSAGPDLGPLGNAIKRTGEGVLAISILASCAPAADIIPTPTKEAGQPHMGAIFETYNFTEFYKTDPSVTDLMAQLEEENGTFDQSWSLNSIQSEKSVNTVQFFGFEEAHVVGFWTMGANKEPLLLKENIQPIKGRYVYDNASGALTYELMVNGTDTAVSQTFLKMSVESNSLISLDSLVMSANSGDADAQAKLTDMLSSNKGNFTIELTNLASGRTDIGTLSPNQMTEVPPTALPSQPSLLDRIMEMGVIPVKALEPIIVPTIEIEGITINDPAVSNPELFDISNTQSPLFKFMNAFIVKQDGETENAFQSRRQIFLDETKSGLKPSLFTIEGKQYVILTSQDISSTKTVNEANIPLLIAEKNESNEWVWSNASMKKMCDLNGLKCGSTVVGDEDYQNPAYNELILNEFSIINSGGTSPLSVSRDGGYPFESEYSLFAQQNGISFRPGHLFDWGDENPDELNTASNAEITDWMTNWVKQEVNGHPFFDSINFANEPVGIYDGSQYWVGEANPWYKAYGEQWPIEAYSMIFKELEAKGLKPGEDVHLILNLPHGAKEWGYNTQFTIDFMRQMQQQIQAKMGPDAKMDIGIQFHLRDVPLSQVDWGGPAINDLDIEKLTQFFQELGKIGPVHITELSTKNVQDKSKAIEGINLVFSAAIRSGAVKDVVFWEALKTNDFLFNAQFQNNPDYYLLLQTLYSNLASSK